MYQQVQQTLPAIRKIILTNGDDKSIRVALIHAIFEDRTNDVTLAVSNKEDIDNIMSCYMQKHYGYRPFRISPLGYAEGIELRDKDGKIIKVTHIKNLPKLTVTKNEKVIILQTTGKEKGKYLLENIEKLEELGCLLLIVGTLDSGEDDILMRISRRPDYSVRMMT